MLRSHFCTPHSGLNPFQDLTHAAWDYIFAGMDYVSGPISEEKLQVHLPCFVLIHLSLKHNDDFSLSLTNWISLFILLHYFALSVIAFTHYIIDSPW